MPATTQRRRRTGKTVKGNQPMLVRIYPRNPQQGYHAERFHLRDSGYPMFKAERGWYEVDAKTAERLRPYRNRNNQPGAKPIFQICTREEAIAVEEAEQEALRRADANTPIPLPRKLAQEEVDWDEDMATDPEEVIPTREDGKTKYVPMSELDYDDEDEEEEIEDPEPINLLDELEDEPEPAPAPRRRTRAAKKAPAKKRATKKAPAKKRATKKASTKKKAAKKKTRRKTTGS